jgi:hypothetical protein
MIKSNGKRLWLRWVAANAAGEVFGLGATFGVAVIAFAWLGEQNDAAGILGMFAIAVASGAIEATVVGLLQWWAMNPWFQAISRRAWWLATLLGALAAYVMGYLPSTLMNLSEDAGQTPTVEPAQWIILLLAAGLGLVGGAVLSFAQWLVLRRAVQGAGVWIPANMLAWAVGMPVIFWGIDAAQKGQPSWQALLIMAAALLLAGILVGAIHGTFLVMIARAETNEIKSV